MYQKQFFAGWGDVDFNAHMKNTAYLDKAVDVRMMYFAENGFPISEFMRRKIGPVVRTDELEYFREVYLLEEIKVDLAVASLSVDGGRFSIRNTFYRADGQVAAKVLTSGGWLDLTARKLVAAPAELLKILTEAPRSEDFRTIEKTVK